MELKRCFLGANTRYGFHSLYGGFCPPGEGRFLNIIKGGPGCGKSSFMGRIGSAAEERGLAVEYVLCSGDPDSLDAVFIPELGVGYVDGTPPHSMEALFPGSAAAYLDLGRFYDRAALKPKLGEIEELNRQYKALYALAYSRIAAGAALLPRCALPEDSASEALDKKLRSFLRREFPSSGGAARTRECFLSSLCCKGRVFLGESIAPDCRVVLLDNMLGLGNVFLAKLLPAALERGCGALIVRDCLDPKLISGLLLPSLSMAVLCSDCGIDPPDKLFRHMRLDTLYGPGSASSRRQSLRRGKRLASDCLALAADTLSEAKALHDELEAVYNPHVDFDGVYAAAEEQLRLLFGP